MSFIISYWLFFLLSIAIYFKLKGNFNMNIFKKLSIVFRSQANRHLDQYLKAQDLSQEIMKDIDNSIYTLMTSLTEVNKNYDRISDSLKKYQQQLTSVNTAILELRDGNGSGDIRKLGVTAIQYTNLIQSQKEALEQISNVRESIKTRIRDLMDSKAETEVTVEVLQAEYETYSSLSTVSGIGNFKGVNSDALEHLKSIAQRSKIDYRAKKETDDFMKSVEPQKETTISSDVDDYIKNL